MGYYPDLSPGDPFRPSAKRENDISHLLNRMNGFDGGRNVPHADRFTVQVYNAGSSALPYGAAVSFVSSGAAIAGEQIPCSAVKNLADRWGVLTTRLEPRQGGTCVVAGPVSVSMIEGSGGAYVVPKISSGAAVYSSGAQVYCRGGGGVPLLYADSSGGIMLLGVGGVTLAAVVTAPTGAYGVGEYKAVAMNSDGTYQIASGGAISMITPFI